MWEKNVKARPGICPSRCQHLISFPSVLKALHLSSVFITVDLPVGCSSICWRRAPPAYFPGEGDIGKLLRSVAPFFLPHTCLDSSQVPEWNWLTCMSTFLFSIEEQSFGKIPAECTAFAFNSCVTTEVTFECSLIFFYSCIICVMLHLDRPNGCVLWSFSFYASRIQCISSGYSLLLVVWERSLEAITFISVEVAFGFVESCAWSRVFSILAIHLKFYCSKDQFSSHVPWIYGLTNASTGHWTPLRLLSKDHSLESSMSVKELLCCHCKQCDLAPWKGKIRTRLRRPVISGVAKSDNSKKKKKKILQCGLLVMLLKNGFLSDSSLSDSDSSCYYKYELHMLYFFRL